MAQQKGESWAPRTISFVGDEEMECWLDEFSERIYGPRGRSELMRRIVSKYREMVKRKRPSLANSSLQNRKDG